MSARFKIICLFLFLIRPLAVHADVPVIGEEKKRIPYPTCQFQSFLLKDFFLHMQL